MSSKLYKSEVRYTWIIALMSTSLIWMINVGIIITEKLIGEHSVNYGPVVVNEITGAYTMLLLLPGLIWFFKRHPFRKKEWYKTALRHMAVLIVYGLCHTSLMTISRQFIYSRAGWPGYDPGILSYRYLMEFQKQFLVYWFIYGIFILFQYIRKNQERQIKTSLLEKQLSQSRLQALKMQLNPHFLFNTLNLISATMYEDVEKADRMIVNLSDLLRQTLNTGDAQQTPLKYELSILDSYLEIMKARFEKKLEIEMDIAPQAREALFPPLVLQTLVENAIKHGMDKTDHVTRISICTEIARDRLEVRVRDNGPGLSSEHKASDQAGIGLTSTRHRLAQLYGQSHVFKLNNLSGKGLEIRMSIPFIQEEDG